MVFLPQVLKCNKKMQQKVHLHLVRLIHPSQRCHLQKFFLFSLTTTKIKSNLFPHLFQARIVPIEMSSSKIVLRVGVTLVCCRPELKE